MALAAIDYVLFGVYLIGTLALGLWLTRYVKSSGDYFLAGRRLPFWAIGMSIVVSDIGATDMIGLGSAGFREGLVVANWDWIGSFSAMVLAGLIFIPFYWRSGVFTVPEFLGRRYNEPTRTLHSVIWLLILVFDVGIVFHATANLAGVLLGFPTEQVIEGAVGPDGGPVTALTGSYWTVVCVIAAFVGVYMIGAGLSAVVLTDVVQLIVMLIGGFAVVGLGLWEVGGPGALVEKVTAAGHTEHFDLYRPADGSTDYPWTGILFGLGLVMSTAYFAGNQTIAQRCLGARSEWDAKASMLVGAVFKALIPLLVVTPGIIALALYAEEINAAPSADQTYPILIKNLLPPGMVGLMFAAFVAAMMSSIDSILNASATLFTKDVYEPLVRRLGKRDPDERELLRVGRIATATVLVASVLTAPMSQRYEGMYEFIQNLLAIVAGPTLAILVLGIFWRRCTAWGGFFGLLVGVAAALTMSFEAVNRHLFKITDPFLYIAFWTFCLSAGVAAAVSALTKPGDEERLLGLTWWGAGAPDVQRELERRAED